MAAKKRGLGRGLDALLSSTNRPAAPPADEAATAEPAPAGGELRHLPVDLIQRGVYQPRTNMHPESLGELADSIRAQGVVQPVVVRPVAGGRFELIAGERRWRAAQLAGLQEIPAVVRPVPDQAAIAMALIENIQRENLNPMEEARALRRLILEFEMTHQQAAEAVGRSRTAVTNLLRLLELAEDVQAMVESGELEMGHARALLGLSGPPQVEAARRVATKGLSVRETERLVKQLGEAGGRPKRPSRPPADPDVRRLENELGERLGARVAIQQGRGGSGRLVITYSSLDELDGIIERMR